MQTEAFISDSGALRLTWQTSDETTPGAGTFRLVVHSAVSGRPLAVAVDERGTGRNTAFVNEDPREFFIVIESTNLQWSVTAEEAVRGTAPAASNR